MVKQYKHILVPLDGSELAELALEDALSIAQLSRAQLTLLQVIPPIDEVIAAGTDHPIYVDQQLANQEMLALEYLQSVCDRVGCEDVAIQVATDIGPAAETIIDYARQQAIDLIVMATHGRSGLQRWVYGSVAGKVLRGADLPVLLVRAHSNKSGAR